VASDCDSQVNVEEKDEEDKLGRIGGDSRDLDLTVGHERIQRISFIRRPCVSES
jgi:hypothetical protein